MGECNFNKKYEVSYSKRKDCNKLCAECLHDCKQLISANLITCDKFIKPLYPSKYKKTRNIINIDIETLSEISGVPSDYINKVEKGGGACSSFDIHKDLLIALFNKLKSESVKIYLKRCKVCYNRYFTISNKRTTCCRDCNSKYIKNKSEYEVNFLKYIEDMKIEILEGYKDKQEPFSFKQNDVDVIINKVKNEQTDKLKSFKINEFNGRILDTRLLGGFTETIKEKIRVRDGYKCVICGKNHNLHVHHIIPRGQGGTHDLDNLATLCDGCHRSIEAGNIDNAIKKCTQRAINQVVQEMNGNE